MVKKLYCYVDESGQNTKGKIFIVSVVVTSQEREKLLSLCEQLEEISGKNKDKWGQADHKDRMLYLKHVFADNRFKGCLRYEIFRKTTDYDTATIKGIVSTISWQKPNSKYTTLIYIDGLRKTKRHEFGSKLRHLGIPIRKIQGVARDETNAFTRLADAIAGFTLDAVDGKSQEIKTLFRKANKEGMIINVSP